LFISFRITLYNIIRIYLGYYYDRNRTRSIQRCACLELYWNDNASTIQFNNCIAAKDVKHYNIFMLFYWDMFKQSYELLENYNIKTLIHHSARCFFRHMCRIIINGLFNFQSIHILKLLIKMIYGCLSRLKDVSCALKTFSKSR
jgi:hypothetical protein